MSLDEFKQWYRNIPRITRWWFTGSVIVPVAAGIGLVKPESLMLMFLKVFRGLQIWRPITAVLYYETGWFRFCHYLLNLIYLYDYSTRFERAYFFGREADYVFLLLFNWFHLIIVGFFVENLMLMSSLILSVVYVYCQLNSNLDMTWGKLQCKITRLPWILLIINIVFGEGFLELLGIVVGHWYYHIMHVYPARNKDRLLSTPAFLYALFPTRGSGFGQAPASRVNQSAERSGETWGNNQRQPMEEPSRPTGISGFGQAPIRSRGISGFGQAPASRQAWDDKKL